MRRSNFNFKEKYDFLRNRHRKEIGIEKPTKEMVWRVDDAKTLVHDGFVSYALPHERHNHRFRVKSQNDPDTIYHVDFNDHQEGFCTCPDWKRNDSQAHQAGIPFSFWHCKHVIAARWFRYLAELDERIHDVDVQATLEELPKLESEQMAIIDQMDDLRIKSDKLSTRIAHIKSSVFAYMLLTNQMRIDTPNHTAFIASRPTRIAVKRLEDVPKNFG